MFTVLYGGEPPVFTVPYGGEPPVLTVPRGGRPLACGGPFGAGVPVRGARRRSLGGQPTTLTKAPAETAAAVPAVPA